MTDQQIEGILRALTADFGLLLAVAASKSGRELARVGDPTNLRWDGLYKSTFGDPQTCAGLVSSLKGQVLPRTMAQGDIHCVLAMPEPAVVVGLFDQRSNDAVVSYRTALAMDVKLREAWRGVGM